MTDSASIITDEMGAKCSEEGVKRRPSQRSSDSNTKQAPTRQPTVEDPEYSDELTPRERKIKIAKQILFSCLKSCSSSLGLMVAVILYSALGGYIFYVLEADNERRGCAIRRNEYLKQEWDIANRLIDVASSGDYELMHDSYLKLLRRFREIVYQVDYTGDNCSLIGLPGGPNLEWSLSGSTMFAVTITTTIGYGHVVPKTFWGKMVCIAYALLGIPLMLLFLANIGDVLADFFKFFYSKICCCGCCRQKPKERPESVTNPPWTTESLGEPNPSTSEHKPPAKGPIIVEDDEDDDLDDENVTIPLTVTLGVLSAYILLGALLFQMWEGWSAGDAAYFSFVTLSTIGFGDFVPGKNGYDDPQAAFNIMMGALYMIFGMAILSMCFTLIQDEMAAKFTWIGKKLGLIKNERATEGEHEE